MLETLTAGAIAAGRVPDKVRILDLWSNQRYGAVLFWVDASLDLYGDGEAVLVASHGRRSGHDAWTPLGAGGMSTESAERILDGRPPGLYRLGGGSSDPLRITIGIATSDVAVIRLESGEGSTDRQPGTDGFFIIGITFNDPVTCAYGVGHAGKSVPGERRLLL
ncbi:MAG: hypothetical protein M3065_19765 [Actinomycetota bacterium]|nr:hypothetical protein [Actinomycetota bacterium]